MADKKTSLVRTAEAAVLLLAGAFIFHQLATGWSTVADHLRTVHWPLLLVAWTVFLIYFLFRAVAWRLIMAALGSKLPPVAAGRIWFLSEFSRYIPGNIWSLLGRVHLADKAGAPKRITAVSLVIEALFLVGAAAVFFGPFLSGFPGLASGPTSDLRWLGLLAVPLILLLLSPGSVIRLANALLKRIKKPLISSTLSRRQLLPIFLSLLIAWFAYGLASYCVAAAFAPLTMSWWWLTAAFIFAWLIGYISLITPMGLGVREGAVVLFLSPTVGAATAGLIALASRLWLIVSELSVLAAIGLAFAPTTGKSDLKKTPDTK
ncbi:flippase-like domain-containing protein [Patescibacteria group bacterium]|nr:flippase-like domain-containing protein [Patescibacteria group bacterium]